MTKRIVSILVALLMVAALLPMSALAKEAASRSGRASLSANRGEPTRDAIASWDFEGDLEGWTNVDADGDGYVWALASVLMAGYIIPAYTGEDCVSSQSYDDSAGALTPDNWFVSPAVEMEALEGNSFSMWYCAQDASYAAEHFQVYAGVTDDTEAMVAISDEITVTAKKASGEWYNLVIDLSEVELEGFEGTVYFAVRHFNCSDMFYLNVDLIEVMPADEHPEPVLPEGCVAGYYFESDDELADFTIISNDSNSYTWTRTTASSAYEGTGYMYVHWQNTPSDWLIAPAFVVPENNASVTLWAKETSTSWGPETFVPYVGLEPTVEAMTPIGDTVSVSSTDYVQYEFDLSAYAGQTIYFAIEYTSNDVFYLYVDALEFWGTYDEEPEPTGEPEPMIIDEIDILGFVEPVWGEEPDFNVYPPEDAHYTFDMVQWWKEDENENNTALEEGDVFDDPDMIYYIEVMVTPEEGYEFAEDIVLKINGDENLVDHDWSSLDDGFWFIMSASFTVEEPEPEPTEPPVEPVILIDTIEIEGFVVPEWGADPFYNVTVPEGAPYSVDYTDWNWWDYDLDDGDVMAPSQAFNNEGYVYYQYFEIVPAEGYAFADEVTVLINGEATYVENGGLSQMGYYWIYTVDFEVEEPAEPTEPPVEPTEPPVVPTEGPEMSDLDRALNIEGGTLHFDTTESYPWITVEEDDRFYAMSGNAGVSSSTSSITTVVNVEAGDIVQFDFKAWGEGSYSFWDHCDFYVNETRVLYYGAYDNDWETFVYAFEAAGEYTLTWSYTKDSSVNPNGDYFAADNVYVGEPVHVEEIIAAESITVYVDRTAKIDWTVLPEAAANKAVTFEIEDETIATIDDNGVVTGVAEGQTTVTITSVENPDIIATVEVTVIDGGFGDAAIYAIATYDIGSSFTDNWITFTAADPGAVTTVAEALDSYAAAYAYGTVFGYTVVTEEPTKAVGGQFYTASIDDLGNPAFTGYTYDESIVTMTFDYTRGCLFGVDGASNLVMIDPASGEVTVIGELETHLAGICSDEEGAGYGIAYTTGDLYAIDFDTAEITLIGATGVGCSYVQDICYDFNTGDIYWAQISGIDDHGLYRVNKNDGSAMYLGPIGPSGAEAVGMFIIPDEEPGADAEVESIQVVPEEVEIKLGDTFQFTAIVNPFNAANKEVEWTVDDESIIEIDADGMVIALALGTATVTATSVENPEISASAIVTVIAPPKVGFYFETQDEVDEWTFVDKDEDGNNWIWSDGSAELAAYEGLGMIYSQSYINNVGALTPDNWAISPAIELPEGCTDAMVTFWAWGQDPSYADENFAVYVGTSADPDEMDKVSDDFTATGDFVKYTVDLSDYVGQTIYIAIRHYNVTDMYFLDVDQVEIWYELEEEPGEIAIHEVYVNGWGTPVEGVAGIDHVFLETPEDAPYYIAYGGWRDETDQQQMYSDDHIFIAGHEYSEGCQIWAEEGYYFAEDCVFYADGGTEILDMQWCYVDEDVNWICYMNILPVVCEGSILWGDANGDGVVDSADVLLVMRYVQELDTIDEENLPVCDVNGDGTIDLADALLIARYTMELIDHFPVEEV